MPRFRTILHLVTALLLTLQMARGSVDAILCLHSENAHLAFAHPESCGDAYADDANAIRCFCNTISYYAYFT